MIRGSFTADDGARLALRAWDPASDPRGTVVLTHGYALDSRCWAPVVAPLTGAGWRALAWDLRGHGGSRRVAGPWTIDRAAADLTGLVQGLDGPVVLVGHSMGAMAVQAALPGISGQVSGVALLASTCGGPGCGALAEARWGRLLYRLGPRTPGAWELGRAVSPARYRATGGALAGYLSPLREFVAPDGGYGGPVLLVSAGRDRLMPRAALAALRERYPEAEVLELPGAGHEIMRYRPGSLGRALVGLLERAAV